MPPPLLPPSSTASSFRCDDDGPCDSGRCCGGAACGDVCVGGAAEGPPLPCTAIARRSLDSSPTAYGTRDAAEGPPWSAEVRALFACGFGRRGIKRLEFGGGRHSDTQLTRFGCGANLTRDR